MEHPRKGYGAVWWLALALVVSNLLGFILHSASHKNAPLPAEIWAYLESEVAPLITVSLGLPLVLLLLERRFRLGERLEQRSEDRQKEVDEHQRERARIEREARAKTMQETLGLWRELLETGYEAAYSSKLGLKPDLVRECRKHVRRLTASFTPLVSTWEYRFPNLSRSELAQLSNGLSPFVDAVDAVLYHLQEAHDTKARSELQSHLGTLMLWMLRPMRSFVEVLSLSIVILELGETPGGDGAELEEKTKALRTQIKILDSRVSQMPTPSSLDLSLARGLLPMLDKKEEDVLNPAFQEWRQWLREHKDRKSTEWPGFAGLERRFAELPHEKVHDVIAMSTSELKALADRCDLLMLAEQLR